MNIELKTLHNGSKHIKFNKSHQFNRNNMFGLYVNIRNSKRAHEEKRILLKQYDEMFQSLFR